MSCFQLSKCLCEEINQLNAIFWCCSTREKNIIHYCSWKHLCLLPKEYKGGLDFRDISIFSQTMLAKQSWQLLLGPNILLSQVLRGKYFKTDNLLNVGLGSTHLMHGEASCGGDSCLSTAITGELGTTSILKFLVILEFQDRVVKFLGQCLVP